MLDHAFVRSGAAGGGGMSLGFSGLHASPPSNRTCSALNHGIGSCACAMHQIKYFEFETQGGVKLILPGT